MKKFLKIAITAGFIALTYPIFGQDIKSKEKDKSASQEIIILKKGDKDSKFTIEINGDRVTINGKPLSEFKDDNITINRRKITVWDKNGMKAFEMPFSNAFKLWNEGNGKRYAFLGVTTEEVEDGVMISEVTKGSAAEKISLKKGDIITKINDKIIRNPEILSEVIRSFKPKEEITLYYKRGGKENSSKVVLGEDQHSSAMSYSFSGPNGNARSYTFPRTPQAELLNALPKMEEWNNQEFNENGSRPFISGDFFPRHQKIGLKIQDTEQGNGVKVLAVEEGSAAGKAGLLKDDIIIEIGGIKVTNTDEAREQLQNNSEKALYPIRVKRGEKEINFEVRIPKKLNTVNL